MFIIDGHNLLHTIFKSEGDSGAITDVGLCKILSRYFTLTAEQGAIIFDGIGPPDKSGFYDISNVEILFAGRGTDADTVIEGKISASTAPKKLTIVSSDRRLRAAARMRKATSVKSDVFWVDVEKQLSRKRPIKDPPEKRQGLNEGETEQWLEFFGFEQ